jgi:hypothetical protein
VANFGTQVAIGKGRRQATSRQQQPCIIVRFRLE